MSKKVKNCLGLSIALIIIGLLAFTRGGLPDNYGVAAAASTNQPSPTSNSYMGSIDQPLTDSVAISNILVDLSVKNLNWLRQPGWLHYVVKEYSPQISKNESPNNPIQDMLADNSIQEDWYHILNDQGDYLESLITIKDDQGKELQKGIATADGESGNLTLLRKGITDDAPAPDKPDQGQYAQINRSSVDDAISALINSGSYASMIRGWKDNIDGEDVFVFSMEGYPKDPILINGYTQPIIGYSIKYVFDLQIGQLKNFEAKYLLGNGEWTVYDSYQYMVAEILRELPVDVAEDFQKSGQELNILLGGVK
jgi:hypothetical protein